MPVVVASARAMPAEAGLFINDQCQRRTGRRTGQRTDGPHSLDDSVIVHEQRTGQRIDPCPRSAGTRVMAGDVPWSTRYN